MNQCLEAKVQSTRNSIHLSWWFCWRLRTRLRRRLLWLQKNGNYDEEHVVSLEGWDQFQDMCGVQNETVSPVPLRNKSKKSIKKWHHLSWWFCRGLCTWLRWRSRWRLTSEIENWFYIKVTVSFWSLIRNNHIPKGANDASYYFSWNSNWKKLPK